jgi:hypothetical protein
MRCREPEPRAAHFKAVPNTRRQEHGARLAAGKPPACFDAPMTVQRPVSTGPSTDSVNAWAGSLRLPILWGVAVGIVQAVSPAGFPWLDGALVWAIGLVIIAPVYIGLAVADGRPAVVAAEVGVATAFIIVAIFAVTVSPWLVVIGLVGHGIKDLWQHRTHFVANTRWWPPFCMVVDAVAAIVIAILLIFRVDFHG